MWPVFSSIGAIFLIGCTLKMMDDWIDREPNSMALKLGRSALPYALLLGTVAITLSPGDAFPLFAASYALGMATELKQPYPLGLNGWQEGLLLLLISIGLTGFCITLGAFLTILAVQVLDDFIDYRSDVRFKRKNIVFALGGFGSAFLGVVALGWAMLLTFHLTLYTFLILPLVLGVVKWGNSKL